MSVANQLTSSAIHQSGGVARLWCLVALLFAAFPVRGGDLESAFDAANRAYEQGKFTEAAALYEKLIPSAPRAGALYFNSGNAWFKAGQTGRAIAAYRQAEALAPRDPGIRFNLQFARKKVTTQDASASSLWQRAFTTLTLNEWAGLLAGAVWLWFALLALREWRPALRAALSGYTATAGVTCLALAGCLAASAQLRLQTVSAVVVASDAIARSGPLDEAKVLHQFRDGLEVTVLDEKEITVGATRQRWLQVRDVANRSGWMKSDQVIELPPVR